MPRFKDQAICIRHLDWSETSQIVVLLTAEHGKIRGLAKGSKRTSKSSVQRYSGGIELLTRGEIVGIIKPTAELATLTEWDLQEPYRHLHTDLDAQRLAMYAADLANALLADHDSHPGAFEAMGGFLAALKSSEEPSPYPLPVVTQGEGKRAGALLRFQWRLLEEAGYRPEVEVDAQSGEALKDATAYTFDPRAGGVTSQPVGLTGNAMGVGPWRVRKETLEVMRAAARGEVAGGEDASAAAVQRANKLLAVYARSILDRQLPTMGYVIED